MNTINRVSAIEILDSRGRPTVGVTCELASGVRVFASVPSGASTGRAEAVERRDGDAARYGGLGCRGAVAGVNSEINFALAGRAFADQLALDTELINFDGTSNKSRLGANAILGVSIAFARAVAVQNQAPLYAHFASILGAQAHRLPRLTINLFSGGKHAGGQVPIQDVLLVPLSARTIDESLAVVFAIYQEAVKLTRTKYRSRGLVADEGGLAPQFPSADAMLADAVEAIEAAGYAPGRDVAIAVDVASSHFFSAGHYDLNGPEPLDSLQMIEQVRNWVSAYPIVSVEDALSEEDWPHWPLLREAIEDKALVLGDDLLCTNPARIGRAIDSRAANALLLKVNQIGTLSEAAAACRLARSAGWAVTVSARSGETEDDWLADLAVGWSGDQIKVGSITRSERLAKYNRLLAIEADAGLPLPQCG